jgi:hypothetical protein
LNSETAGTFNFTIQGTDGILTHATPTETLTVGTNGTVTVSPASATLFANEAGNLWLVGVTQQQFTANQSVTWAVTGGNANGTVNETGLYSAPALVPSPTTVAITATSATSAGSAFVTVAAPTPLGASQIMVTATAAGGAAIGDVVTLTVQ